MSPIVIDDGLPPAKYQKRPGPPLSAANSSQGMVMRGNDGYVYQIAVNKNGIQSWKRCVGQEVTHVLACEEEARDLYNNKWKGINAQKKEEKAEKAAEKAAKDAAEKAAKDAAEKAAKAPKVSKGASRTEGPRPLAERALGVPHTSPSPSPPAVCRGVKKGGDPCTQTKLNAAGYCRFHTKQGE
ncbi:hypothetical protein KIPB_011388 [Kipferlia bialata]|uniref:Uncharacterized protein n=1 Tax=Kipferlia bialata TaxID=797122 RepID=A0A9K3D7Z1_9EUKA|nr:hypothetical protein KIPB_011388 [Kipferlia bialata]|eukprot:g11388.t1